MSQFSIRSVENCHVGDNSVHNVWMARRQKKMNFFQHAAQIGRKLRFLLTNEEMFLHFRTHRLFLGYYNGLRHN